MVSIMKSDKKERKIFKKEMKRKKQDILINLRNLLLNRLEKRLKQLDILENDILKQFEK